MIKQIVLILSVVMPPDQPDLTQRTPQPTIEECWKHAQEFVSHELDDDLKRAGAIGLGATCAYAVVPGKEI